jgi:ribonuclease Y
MDTGILVLAIALALAVIGLIILALKARATRGHGVDAGELRALIAQAVASHPDVLPRTDRPAAAPASGIPTAAFPEAASPHAAAPGAALVAGPQPDDAGDAGPMDHHGAATVGGGSTAGLGDPGEPAPAPYDGTALRAMHEQARQAAERDAESIREAARREAATDRAALEGERARVAESSRTVAESERAVVADRADIARQRTDIAEREQALRQRMVAADNRQLALDQNRAEIDAALADLDRQRADLATEADAHRQAHEAELARISALTVEAARAELVASQEDVIRRDVALMARRMETEAQSTAKDKARRIVADAISRVASDQTSQSVVSVLQLPSDELKGRIIGREGRNIRAFENITGVNVIIDDTPEAVLLSCFDPVRREVARVTLQALIDDGRIHPHRIEEAFERAGEEVESLCFRAAEDALLDVGITDLHPELVALIGQLKYRTSYGQNVLAHLVETSHIARLMAAELGVDPVVTARGAFLHDIGKALTHEAQGSHAMVGAEIARKYGESADVVHCIEAHHDEVVPSTVEAVLTQAADACSGGRPGARRESLESYVQRLEHIEAIASAKRGVDKVFAMQAGRELRVMVKPDMVDDLEAHLIAREVAKQIEEELTYPGQVRVTVIRESRATEVAR